VFRTIDSVTSDGSVTNHGRIGLIRP